MLVNGKHTRSIWIQPDNDRIIQAIDQRYLPFEFKVENLKSVEDVFFAIRDMHLRGAPLIGAAASAGIYLALLNMSSADDPFTYLSEKAEYLKSSRPTAVNLGVAIDRQLKALSGLSSREDMIFKSLQDWERLVEDEVVNCRKIGEFALPLIEKISQAKDGLPVNILTHCNAGWLACID